MKVLIEEKPNVRIRQLRGVMDDRMPKPSEPGRVPCLKCGRVFKSPDRIRIRRCSKCKKAARDLGRLADCAHDVPSELEED